MAWESSGGLKGRSPTGIAFILFLTTLAAYIARVNLSVALPFISDDYGWTSVEEGLYGGLLLGIFLVGYGVSNVILSPLVDRFGPRKSKPTTTMTAISARRSPCRRSIPATTPTSSCGATRPPWSPPLWTRLSSGCGSGRRVVCLPNHGSLGVRRWPGRLAQAAADKNL